MYTGARLRDCCRILWKDLELGAGKLKLRQLKTGTEIEVSIHGELHRHLEARAPSQPSIRRGFLTPSLADAETSGAHRLSRQFSEIMTAAGVSAGKVSEGTRQKPSERGFHSLCRTFISALVAADISAEVRMKLSGHADLKSHTAYTHTAMQLLADALKRVQFDR